MSYYNYKLEEVLDMEVKTYNTLSQLMYINEARESLRSIDVSCYPNMKTEARKKMHKRLYKVAYPSNFEQKNVVKLSDLTKVLK